ncbi:hypothetical protein E2493_12050 [Sphingomonas parva]|uniref:Uncharacterized protein n=1 Tax=Sphingomonas parva TaxID=2555898 RepID=A0A4Y8ZPJ0_9SPHN|nr:hypothetical protein [Sphingomonas parva]TFI57923.1 hypothetical protein E2493_12050 [Sphingomonas parva]
MPPRPVPIAFAALFLSPPAAYAQTPPAVAGIERRVQEVRAELLKPGPVVPGWNVGGADPALALERAGADQHYLLIEDGEERIVQIRSDRRIAHFAPGTWRPIDSYGSAIAYAERPSIGFAPIGTRFVIGTRVHGWRENGLTCSKGMSHAILYEIPGAPADGLSRDAAIGMFRISMLALEDQTICERAEGSAATGWRIRSLLPDGRDLPALNQGEPRLTVVPAAPIAELVRGKRLEPTDGTAER